MSDQDFKFSDETLEVFREAQLDMDDPLHQRLIQGILQDGIKYAGSQFAKGQQPNGNGKPKQAPPQEEPEEPEAEQAGQDALAAAYHAELQGIRGRGPAAFHAVEKKYQALGLDTTQTAGGRVIRQPKVEQVQQENSLAKQWRAELPTIRGKGPAAYHALLAKYKAQGYDPEAR